MNLSVDLWSAVRDSDLIGIICNIVLAYFSLRSWALIFGKWIWLKRVEGENLRFEDDCIAHGGSLEESFKRVKHYRLSPTAAILREAFLEHEVSAPLLQGADPGDNGAALEAVRESIRRVIDRTLSDEQDKLEESLGFLATTANVAPMIGLFGTVWGILGSFQALAFKGSVAIQTLAPGLSTALSTTVFGLFAAIPAALAFNYFTGRVRRILTDMDMFALEMLSVIEKRLVQGR
ncbi:MAG: protein TolQ [Candidatus Sumerlaeia bacterium]